MTSIEKSRRQPDAETDSTGRAPWWQGPLSVLKRTKKPVVRAVRPDPSASWALVALRQRVLVGVVADNYRVYGSGRVRKIDR
jgi:hypothetical protein